MPLDGVADMVKPTEQQRDALEQIRAAVRNAVGSPFIRMSHASLRSPQWWANAHNGRMFHVAPASTPLGGPRS